MAFKGPNINGQTGCNGFVLSAPAGWERNGTIWKFRYERSDSASGVVLIHPHGKGQVLVLIHQERLAVFTGGPWPGQSLEQAFSWFSDMPVTKTNKFKFVFPLDASKSHEVTSELWGDDLYNLTIDGKDASNTSPLLRIRWSCPRHLRERFGVELDGGAGGCCHWACGRRREQT